LTDVIALGSPTFGNEELEAVRAVLASGWVAGQGPHCLDFEQRFAATCQTGHALAVSNCTAALHLALLALGVGRGDEVIVADYTFPATGHAVMHAGAVPKFADVRTDIWTIDVGAIDEAIGPRTVGIISVDMYGQCADYDELSALAARRGLFLVEDAAAAAGATYRGRPAGSLADVGCFSFHGRKGITCGEGGALTTDRDEIAAFARKVHAFGIESALTRQSQNDLPIPVFDELGFNYKLSDVAAAIMLVQLERLPSLLARRQTVAEKYATLLGDFELVRCPIALADRSHCWQSYALVLDASVPRGPVASALRERGVQCNFGTYASHLQPVYGGHPPCPVSADAFARHLAIPMHANLTDTQIERVAQTVRDVVTHVVQS
jgi:dTDP-4-amino-4,6-dideoxygalactose transaminase